MSRQAHLPPRCPFQRKTLSGCGAPSLNGDTHLRPRHQKSVSHSSAAEEKPAWLDDLLDESDLDSSGLSHRRSASDSLTILDNLVPLKNLHQFSGSDNSVPHTTGGVLDSASVYGPNSPRAKGKIAFAEDAIASALSEYISQEHLWNFCGDMCSSGAAHFDAQEDTCEIIAEGKPAKRHPGQRSRVRKLQYIAELERTVDILQKVERDMASRVASLLQQRVSLSLENNKLKQQAARLQREKQIVDGQYRSLRKEVERLKYLAYASDRKVNINLRRTTSADIASTEAHWQVLDMGNLDLN
ncbi:OLC1v1026437C6 [Oldenlandia corymbosa var. corymbosa]|uniref:OLC1v1026437C6 n=1 Tax=Oldenlandia corymbosa var. corymbosa TaxID=529605 RepID=A0AAV1C6Z8_OLDCO|nr:OLC1v1026437C6 [Oldenlandia corymbosa var. corymbosa]